MAWNPESFEAVKTRLRIRTPLSAVRPHDQEKGVVSGIPPPASYLRETDTRPHMGRTIPTYRLHLESILNDWMDYRRALREKDREAFDRLLNKSRQHASAASYCAHIDPSILAILSILLEMEREIEALKRERSSGTEESARP